MRPRWADYPPKFAYWLLCWEYAWTEPEAVPVLERWLMIDAQQQETLNDRYYSENVRTRR